MTYAILQKSTGKFLPPYRGRAGGTWVEPAWPSEVPPRLFRREQDAKAALAWWLEGRVTARYDEYGEFDGDLSFRKVPERDPDDMVVVQVSIVWSTQL